MLVKTSGMPEEMAAENQAMALTVGASVPLSLDKGMKRMELTTVERRSGKYEPTLFFQSYFIPFRWNPLKSRFTTRLLISAPSHTLHF